MSIRYSVDDARMRLQYTLILFRGDVVYVDEISYDGIKLYHPLKDVYFSADYDDDGFDLRAFSPGWTNFSSSASFITRSTERYYKVGMDNPNCYSDFPIHSHDTMRAIALTIKGVFPSWPESLKKVRQLRKESVALSPRVAISHSHGTIALHFMRDIVGRVEDDLVLLPEFDRLLPAIKEDLACV